MRYLKQTNSIAAVAMCSILFITACSDDEGNLPAPYNPPESYSFDNVSFSGQTDRLNMLSEMISTIDQVTSGTAPDATTLLNMYANENSPFSDPALNASTKQLKSKTYSGLGAIDADEIEAYINAYAQDAAMYKDSIWAPGQPGIVTKADGSGSYFLNADGVEYSEIIEKTLMHAVFYYQACEVYTREGKIGDAVDNTIVTPGKGTDMEHHWDEAFGYWGVPTDATASNFESADLKYFGKYAKKGEAVGIPTFQNLLGSFIKGRYGISNMDYTMRDEAAAEVRQFWEMVSVTTGIHYLNGAIANVGDDAKFYHELSEAYTFIQGLAYNQDRLISTSDWAAMLALIEVNGEASFTGVSVADLNSIKDQLASIYGLEAVKDQL
ncbi:MAG: DUF4856 domain-containing protein [Bacteroidota bacterium]|nr:DUF4856 domain-containing protein [Bacteroidota bacterium]